MLRTLGIVQAGRTSSLPHPNVARKLGGKSLLEWVVRQATDCERLDRVIVLASDAPGDADLAPLVPPDVSVLSSGNQDALSQLIDAVDRFRPRAVVRVCADSPFIDPVLIDRLVTTADEHPSCDYISYCLRDGRPAILSKVGFFAEWFRADALSKAALAASANSFPRREDVTRYIIAHPEAFQVRLLAAPDELDRDDVRLCVDTEEDWEHAQAIYDALGPERLDWRRIAELLAQHPELRGRMATLNRAGAT